MSAASEARRRGQPSISVDRRLHAFTRGEQAEIEQRRKYGMEKVRLAFRHHVFEGAEVRESFIDE